MKKPITDWDKYRIQFVREALRKASFRWPPRGMAIKAARTRQLINPSTGRLCWHVGCAKCNKEILEKEGQLDHIEPAIPVLSSMRGALSNIQDSAFSLGSLVYRMYPEARGFQVLCAECHAVKTKGENNARREAKRRNKQS